MQNYRIHIPMWIAAIESGYLKEPAWTAWAERHIVGKEPTPSWLVDLYQAADAKTALSVLYSAYPDVVEQEPAIAAMLGFLYLRYENGELTFSEFLSQAGAEADAHNYNDPSCERIYAVLTCFEQALAQGQSDAPCKREAQAMFARHRALAKDWLTGETTDLAEAGMTDYRAYLEDYEERLARGEVKW